VAPLSHAMDVRRLVITDVAPMVQFPRKAAAVDCWDE
jgi:hypothetical protein